MSNNESIMNQRFKNFILNATGCKSYDPEKGTIAGIPVMFHCTDRSKPNNVNIALGIKTYDKRPGWFTSLVDGVVIYGIEAPSVRTAYIMGAHGFKSAGIEQIMQADKKHYKYDNYLTIKPAVVEGNDWCRNVKYDNLGMIDLDALVKELAG